MDRLSGAPRFFCEKSGCDPSAKDLEFSQKIRALRNFRRKFAAVAPGPAARSSRKDAA
jgi:hypothetical protein